MAKKSNFFSGLVIRTAVVASPRYGFVYACDPKKEKAGAPHAIVCTIDGEAIEPGDYNYSAHSACLIEEPDAGVVDVSEPGYYTANTEGTLKTGDIFTSSKPPPKNRRAGGIRSVHSVGGMAYAVGIRGMVYRLDAPDRWLRIDEGLPETFDVQAIGGLRKDGLFAVGFRGEIWSYDGKRWQKQDVPTNRNLTSVKAAPDGTILVGGHGGILLRGHTGAWSVIDHDDMTEDVWDIECFANKTFVSTLDGLFELVDDHLRPVKYGKHTPKTTYQLSIAGEVMWSSGEHDIMEYDGKVWTQIV